MPDRSENIAQGEPAEYPTPDQGPYSETKNFAVSVLRQLRLPILAFFYVGIFVFIDQYVDNINRYFIFCNLLVVSSLYFSWYLGGRETMLYVAFFNLFFAFIFSRLMYVSKVISAPLFLGKSFLLLYVITLVFMAFMIRKESPADRKRRRRKQLIKEEFQRNRQLELMVATQKVSQDVVRQANRVKDELLLLQNSWRSQIHSIINDLSPVAERELYDQVVRPFQEDILAHLRKLENRMSFNPRVMRLSELHAYMGEELASDKKFGRGKTKFTIVDKGWAFSDFLVVVDAYKTWEILLNLIRNSQTAVDLKQIELMRENPGLLKTFEPRIEVAFALEDGAAVFRVSDTGGGVDPEQLPLMFQKPLPSKKRAQKSFGQGTIFVKFFGESMGFDIRVENSTHLGEPGLTVSIHIPEAPDFPIEESGQSGS